MRRRAAPWLIRALLGARARILATLTIVTYALAVEQAIVSGFGGWIFLVSEPLYWPTLAFMIVIAGDITRAEKLSPWRLWRATSETDLCALCRKALCRPAFAACFWLNWAGALILPLYLLASHPDLTRPAQAVLVGEAVSTFLWRLPAVFHTQRSRRGPSLAALRVWGTSE
jgi:hypothetical protein